MARSVTLLPQAYLSHQNISYIKYDPCPCVYPLTLDDVRLVVIATYGPSLCWASYIYLSFIMDTPPPAEQSGFMRDDEYGMFVFKVEISSL